MELPQTRQPVHLSPPSRLDKYLVNTTEDCNGVGVEEGRVEVGGEIAVASLQPLEGGFAGEGEHNIIYSRRYER